MPERGQYALATGSRKTSTRSIRTGDTAMRPASRTTPSMCSVCNFRIPVDIQLEPREHLNYQWLAWQDAAEKVFSPSNRAAILELPRRIQTKVQTEETPMSEKPDPVCI